MYIGEMSCGWLCNSSVVIDGLIEEMLIVDI